jgi:hypothetical protein
LQLLRELTNDTTSKLYRWPDILAATEKVLIQGPAEDREQVLADVLQFTGVIRLDPKSELPHSMAAEEMLKSLAVQVLANWAGARYLTEIRRVGATAHSPILAAIVNKVVDQIIWALPVPQILEEGGRSFQVGRFATENDDPNRFRPASQTPNQTPAPMVSFSLKGH